MIRCRRGVSGVIAGLFLVLVFLLALLTHMMVQAQKNAYDQAVKEENQRDVERLNEKIEIIWARVNDDDNLTIIVHNYGGVTAHLVDLWIRAYQEESPDDPLWQRCYPLQIYLEPGRITILPEPEPFGEYNESKDYEVKIVTERGNFASVHVPYPPIPEGGGGGGLGFYPIIIETMIDNFQFRDLWSSDPLPGEELDPINWEYAWIKEQNNQVFDHVIYRVMVNNTTNRTIIIDSESYMMQTSGTMSALPRYIVDPQWDTSAGKLHPDPFTYQEIPAKDHIYLYFASNSTSPTAGWVADPNLPVCPVSFQIFFYFADQPGELIALGLPVQVQQLT